MKRLCVFPVAMLFMLAVILLFSCSAWADFNFPPGITVIAEEAFMNVPIGNSLNNGLLVFPDEVQTIESKAFHGAGIKEAILPSTLSYIAPDAFDQDVGFMVMPNSYAQNWCIQNDYDWAYIPFEISSFPDNTVYPDSSALVYTSSLYFEEIDFYQWEKSYDGVNWTLIEGESNFILNVEYQNIQSYMYIRCRGFVNNSALPWSNEIILNFYPSTLAFDNYSGAISGDSVFLHWDYRGPAVTYYIHQWIPDEQVEQGGSWKQISVQQGTNYYTVYGLEKNATYYFTVVGIDNWIGGDGTNILRCRFETKPISITTLNTQTVINMTACHSNGTSIYLSWNPIDRAEYAVLIGKEGGDLEVLGSYLNNDHATLYGLEPNTKYNIVLAAIIQNNAEDEGTAPLYYYFSPRTSVTTGAESPAIQMNMPVVCGETVQLSWSELPDSRYYVFMTREGEDEPIIIEENILKPYYDVGGLEHGATYSFQIMAFSKWTFSEWDWPTVTEKVQVTIPEKNPVEYRALLIGEESFTSQSRSTHFYNNVEYLDTMLKQVRVPNSENPYSVLRRKDLSREEILSAINVAFQETDENDVSLFYIATHGDVNWNGRRAGTLLTVDEAGNEGTIRMEDLAAALSEVEGRVIVWIESCGAGAAIYDNDAPQNGDDFGTAVIDTFSAFDSGIESFDDNQETFYLEDTEAFETGEFRQPKFYVLTAAQFQQVSYGMTDLLSYFTFYLLNGVMDNNGNMPADTNGDGRLTQHELFSYIKIMEEYNNIPQDVQAYPFDSDYVLFKK